MAATYLSEKVVVTFANLVQLAYTAVVDRRSPGNNGRKVAKQTRLLFCISVFAWMKASRLWSSDWHVVAKNRAKAWKRTSRASLQRSLVRSLARDLLTTSLLPCNPSSSQGRRSASVKAATAAVFHAAFAAFDVDGELEGDQKLLSEKKREDRHYFRIIFPAMTYLRGH